MSNNELIWPAKGALAVPGHQATSTITIWTDYAVWGLDIYDNQPTWFSLIELIIVLTDRWRKGARLLVEMPVDSQGIRSHEQVDYVIYTNGNLRHLMFRDQDILPLSERNTVDQAAIWTQWLAGVKKDFPNLDLSYLRTAFNDDFNKFSEAVGLLRSAEVEPGHAKRWSSKHLLPVGDAALFPDFNPKAGGPGNLDRRFFRRSGEIFYLMLSRASGELKNRLEPLLGEKLFTKSSPWNSIAHKLQGKDADLSDASKFASGSFAYLPLPQMDRYDRLAEDWIAVLGHDRIPIEDSLDYLMRLSGLHEVLYIAERAASVHGASEPVFYLDMLGNTPGNQIKNLSLETYKVHKNLTKKAVEAYIQSYFDTDEWASVGNGANAVEGGEAAQRIRDRFLFKTSHKPAHPVNKEEQARELLVAAANRSHAIGSAFTAHARQIGFLSLKQGVGGWYTPTDALLEALVVANVDGVMEYGEFLRTIYRRYSFVVGSEEAKTSNKGSLPAPGELFVANERRFEERLLALGFVDRKSDDCAFVINPFSAGKHA